MIDPNIGKVLRSNYLFLSSTKLIRMYFDIQRDKTVPEHRKSVILSRIQKASEKMNFKQLKSEAAVEMLSSERGQMYKIFCQCIALTGKIGY